MQTPAVLAFSKIDTDKANPKLGVSVTKFNAKGDFLATLNGIVSPKNRLATTSIKNLGYLEIANGVCGSTNFANLENTVEPCRPLSTRFLLREWVDLPVG